MAKVHVIARFVALEGKENQLRALLQGMLTPTRAESECESYELYESDSRGRFYLNETWDSQAALDQHMTTPHFERLKQSG
jgi:quinol monooxygenase YgiN